MIIRPGVHIDEDQLTNGIFGALRYMPAEIWIKSFFETIKKLNPKSAESIKTPSADDITIELWPTYQIPEEWQKVFCQQSKNKSSKDRKTSITPDAQITTKDLTMFVESEYSHPRGADAEQLFQQFAIAKHYSEKQNKEFFILLVNKELFRPWYCGIKNESVNRDDTLEKYIESRCRHCLKLKITEKDVKQKLLWINWQVLYSLFEGLKNKLEQTTSDQFIKMVVTMIEDVCGALKKVGLMPVDLVISTVLIEPEKLPFMPTIKPIMDFLEQCNIDPEILSRWQKVPDILKFLNILQIYPEYISAPISLYNV